MKRLFSIILSITCLLCASALAESHELATEHIFNCSVTETIFVENMIFNEAVTIYGDPNASSGGDGKLLFVNCIFNAGITFLGNSGDIVVFADGCEFANNAPVVMAGELKEATIETSLPRVITCVPINYFSMVRSTLVASGVEEIIVNGEIMRMADCTNAVDPNTGESLEYDASTPYSYFLVSQWWENGEKIDFIAVTTD